jgi:hypothetical protein
MCNTVSAGPQGLTLGVVGSGHFPRASRLASGAPLPGERFSRAKKNAANLAIRGVIDVLVGVRGFEPPASTSRT